MFLTSRTLGLGTINDITKLPMSSFIQGRATVLIRAAGIAVKGRVPLDTSSFTSRGVLNKAQFNMTGIYADDGDDNKVIQQQHGQLQTNRTTPNDPVYQLLWTLTSRQDIVGAANNFNTRLASTVWSWVSRNSYPNIITVDAYPDDSYLAAFAMAIMLWLAPKC
jgi:hypothetical protein